MKSVQNNVFVLLLGCFSFGYLNIFGKFAIAKKANFEVDDNMQLGDYESYSEDEESPEQMKEPLKSTMMPYFMDMNKTIYSKEGSDVELDCPAKNYNESQHLILWFKDGKPITNGKQSLSNSYQLDNDFNLTIGKIDEKSLGDYTCSVLPQNVSRQIHLKFADTSGAKVLLQTRVPNLLIVILIEKIVETLFVSKPF